mmetsp:Transcript_78375/g.229747  ORF Transcript_78375/g.229747 Transcript_78375/m.229747 type:complete len:402 (+) Transcript_78375:53-1258(+)
MVAPTKWPAVSCKKDLEFEKLLGKGFFGEVWQARVRQSGSDRPLAAVKRIRLAHVAAHGLTHQLQREIGILYSLQHPRCIRLHSHFDHNGSTYLVLEFASGGTLWQRLSRVGSFEPQLAARYFAETCDALCYLHGLPEKVVHRDIKPENILLDGEDHVKLADFGWAHAMQNDKLRTFCGTLEYLPPEMLRHSGHDESADMWNMGVLLFELTTGLSPFRAVDKEATYRLILRAVLKYPAGLDEDARDLISRLCRKRPSERPSAKEAAEHRFVAKFAAAKEAAPANAEKASSSNASVEEVRRQERKAAEMRQLLAAKQHSEETLALLADALDESHAALRAERRRRLELEAAGAELAGTVEAREREVLELRERLEQQAVETKRLVPDDTARSGRSFWSKKVGGG